MFELLVCIAASIGAGTTAGLAGISTATVISPLLIALLGFDAYEASGHRPGGGRAVLRSGRRYLRPPQTHPLQEKACWC